MNKSLLDHLKHLALSILDAGEGPIDVALLSKTLKRQLLQHTGNDSFLPVASERDTSQLHQALRIFGCGRLLANQFDVNPFPAFHKKNDQIEDRAPTGRASGLAP